MLRSQIPARLRVARAADCQRIPVAALAKMTPADVAPRLLAADEFRRRAAVPHLDGDLVRYRTGLASEVLTTTDPKRAAKLVKAAGITPQEATPAAGSHKPFTGTHTHAHTDNGVRGNPLHVHAHSHDGDTGHGHAHVSAKSGQLAKAVPAGAQRSTGKSITVPTPALDDLGRSRSLLDGLNDAARKGHLGALRDELGLVAAAHAEVSGVSKAARYERQAARVTDPETRRAYEELARQERAKAGAL